MISVVIPLYNKAHTIVHTLQTVMNQTYKDFEVVIVNDGSTDHGVEVIKSNFCDSRIRIINQDNAGVSMARNRGVRESRGEYVAFLDGDDKWHPEYLGIMAQTIIKYPKAVMLSSAGIIETDGVISYRIANKYINQISKVDYFENPFVFSHTSSTVVRKDAFFLTDGFPDGMKCLEDFAMFYQMALIGDFVYVGLPISKYVGGVEGQITRSDESTRFSFMPAVVRFYNSSRKYYLKSGKHNRVFKTYFKYDLRHRIKCYLKESDPKWMDYFYKGLDKDAKSQLNRFERYLYKNRQKRLSVLWINLTKIVWRSHNYPYIGEKIDTTKINPIYTNW